MFCPFNQECDSPIRICANLFVFMWEFMQSLKIWPLNKCIYDSWTSVFSSYHLSLIRCFGYFTVAFISDGTEQQWWADLIYPLTDTAVMGSVWGSLFQDINEHWRSLLHSVNEHQGWWLVMRLLCVNEHQMGSAWDEITGSVCRCMTDSPHLCVCGSFPWSASNGSGTQH